MADTVQANTFISTDRNHLTWLNGLGARKKRLIAAIIAEFLGSMFLILLAVGIQANEVQTDSLLTTDHSDLKTQSGYILTVAIAHGITYAVLTELFHSKSGAHFNPAVTVAAIVGHRVEPLIGVMYIITQITGGVVGAAMYNGLSGDKNYGELGINKVNTDFNTGQIFGVEYLCSTFVVLTWYTVFHKTNHHSEGPPYVAMKSQSACQAIGLAYTVAVLLTARWDSAGLNPIRAFGPSAVANKWKHQWVFWLAPIMGGLTGTLLGELFDFLAMGGKTRKISPE